MANGRRGKRGGYQPPANPAAVSGPGALARRTDGGAGDRQPMRLVNGQGYGDRQAMAAQQSAAPMYSQPSPVGGGQAPPPGPPPSIFAPTERPWEPLTAGAPVGPGPNPIVPRVSDIEMTLREAYRRTHSPHLLRLIDRLSG